MRKEAKLGGWVGVRRKARVKLGLGGLGVRVSRLENISFANGLFGFVYVD